MLPWIHKQEAMHTAMRVWSEQKLPSQPARVFVIVYPACFKEGESEDDDAPAIVFQAFFCEAERRLGWELLKSKEVHTGELRLDEKDNIGYLAGSCTYHWA